MLKKMICWFTFPLEKEYREGYYKKVLQSDFKLGVVLSLLIASFEAVMMLIYVHKSRILGTSEAAQFYFRLYVLLFASSIIVFFVLILGRHKLEEKPRIFIILISSFTVVICIWGGILSGYSHRAVPDLSVFTYVMVCVAVVACAQPWVTMLILLLGEVVLISASIYYAGDGVSMYATIINSVITMLLSIVINTVLYYNKVVAYQQTMTIMNRNEEIRHINKQLQSIALTDALTNAFNRRYFDEKLPEALREAKQAQEPVSIMLMDIDFFKQYNDFYGHQAGDECLKKVANVIHKSIQDIKASFVRYGGEEFLLFIPGMNEQTGFEMAENIRKSVEKLKIEHREGCQGFVTISIGFYCSIENRNEKLYQVVNYADKALYDAKSKGRNQVKTYFFE